MVLGDGLCDFRGELGLAFRQIRGALPAHVELALGAAVDVRRFSPGAICGLGLQRELRFELNDDRLEES